MASRDPGDLRPVVRRVLLDIPFPRTRQQLIAYAGIHAENTDVRRILTQIPERTYDNLDQVLAEVYAFQERIRQQTRQA